MGIPGITTIVNVYGPQSIIEKRKLWEEFLELKRGTIGISVFLIDFKVVRYASDRFNSSFCHYTTSYFNHFIADSGLHEFNTSGMKYTFQREDDMKFSKLDRFLVCQNFIQAQTQTSVTNLPCEHSDHSLVILKPYNADFGTPPF